MSLRVQVRFLILSLIILFAIGACSSALRTEFLMEITQEVTREVFVVVTATSNLQMGDPMTSSPTDETTTAVPTQALATPTPTLDLRPTNTVNQIIVAEQLFQFGRMFYLQPNGAIWVLLYEDETRSNGVWSQYVDTWNETMMEFDPENTPPSGLYQPKHGFGKLWRETEAVRASLGWAIEPEVGRLANYEYSVNGLTVDGEWFTTSAVHMLDSQYGEIFVFNEPAMTWGLQATPGQ